MKRPLAVLATALSCATASAAAAQTASGGAPFSTPIWASAAPAKDDPAAALALLNGAAFNARGLAEAADPIGRLLDHETYLSGEGLVRWMTGETPLTPAAGGGPVDSLRVRVGGTLRTPGGLLLNPSRAQFEGRAYEVAVTRDWPAALAFAGHGLGLDITPHAGVGVTSLGGSAEAGATLRVMSSDATVVERLKALGVRDGAATFGDKGRWYLFAAASGRAVGLNMLHNEQGWDRAGVTTDSASTLVGDAQVGVGFRKGAMQTSLGYVHREVKGQNMLFGVDPKSDSMVAFSLQIRPRN